MRISIAHLDISYKENSTFSWEVSGTQLSAVGTIRKTVNGTVNSMVIQIDLTTYQRISDNGNFREYPAMKLSGAISGNKISKGYVAMKLQYQEKSDYGVSGNIWQKIIRIYLVDETIREYRAVQLQYTEMFVVGDIREYFAVEPSGNIWRMEL